MNEAQRKKNTEKVRAYRARKKAKQLARSVEQEQDENELDEQDYEDEDYEEDYADYDEDDTSDEEYGFDENYMPSSAGHDDRSSVLSQKGSNWAVIALVAVLLCILALSAGFAVGRKSVTWRLLQLKKPGDVLFDSQEAVISSAFDVRRSLSVLQEVPTPEVRQNVLRNVEQCRHILSEIETAVQPAP